MDAGSLPLQAVLPACLAGWDSASSLVFIHISLKLNDSWHEDCHILARFLSTRWLYCPLPSESHTHTHQNTQSERSKKGRKKREALVLERALKRININCSSSWNDNTDKMPLWGRRAQSAPAFCSQPYSSVGRAQTDDRLTSISSSNCLYYIRRGSTLTGEGEICVCRYSHAVCGRVRVCVCSDKN